jgi:hypothetical protein
MDTMAMGFLDMDTTATGFLDMDITVDGAVAGSTDRSGVPTRRIVCILRSTIITIPLITEAACSKKPLLAFGRVEGFLVFREQD